MFLFQQPIFLLSIYFLVSGVFMLVAPFIPALKRIWYKNIPDTVEKRRVAHRFGLSGAAVFLFLGLALCMTTINLNMTSVPNILWTMVWCFFLSSFISLGFLFYYRGKLSRTQ